jgi:hypothetical protein
MHETTYNMHETTYNMHETTYNMHETTYNMHETTPYSAVTQVVLSSDTLSALTGTGSSTYGAIIHLGAHVLENNVHAHQKMKSIYGSGYGADSKKLDPTKQIDPSGPDVDLAVPSGMVVRAFCKTHYKLNCNSLM